MIETETLIVGSGPAGVNAAWPLVLAGRSVVMIDADISKNQHRTVTRTPE
jgi:thioredoxin reductase